MLPLFLFFFVFDVLLAAFYYYYCCISSHCTFAPTLKPRPWLDSSRGNGRRGGGVAAVRLVSQGRRWWLATLPKRSLQSANEISSAHPLPTAYVGGGAGVKAWCRGSSGPHGSRTRVEILVVVQRKQGEHAVRCGVGELLGVAAVVGFGLRSCGFLHSNDIPGAYY